MPQRLTPAGAAAIVDSKLKAREGLEGSGLFLRILHETRLDSGAFRRFGVQRLET